MSKLFIHGGRQLHGSVSVSGSKNAALPILSACLLSGGEKHISNVPNLKDVETLMSLLKAMELKYRKLELQLTVYQQKTV